MDNTNDFKFCDGEITAYTGNDTQVTIPEQIAGQTVTKIGVRAFSNKNLTSVEIPYTVDEIGVGAFCICKQSYNFV